MNIETSLKKLFSLHTFGIKLGLNNIRGFMEYLGNPQRELKTFHLAGSNGKGSTAAFLASMLKELDYKTGLYTSPHFVRFNERIKINNEEISDEYIADFVSKHESYIDRNKLTFFEVTTALAFVYFREMNVDYAVIETGLGGRLDATNVLNPLAVIITSISKEHTNILGEEIEQIAFEKAEIIKPGAKVFTGRLSDAAIKVVQKKCEAEECELFRIEDYTNEKENYLELYSEEIELDDWTMPLRGNYQKFNAALAALAVSKSLDVKNNNLLSAGIKNVVENTGLQGRFEYYNNEPDIIFDSSHNPDGLENFLAEFKKKSVKYSEKNVLFGAMSDKAISEMLSLLGDEFDNIYVTEIDYERSAGINKLLEISKAVEVRVTPVTDAAEFLVKFRERDPGECLVVLGSMYLLGKIKSDMIMKKIS